MKLLDNARRIPRRYWLYYLPLVAAVIGFAVFLDRADLPWEKGVAAREAAGKVVKSEHHMVSGLWYGAWASLAVLALLAAAGPLATRPLSRAFTREDAGLGRRSTPLFLVFAACAVTIAGFRMAPRLDSSLWGDEDYTMRRAIVGQYERNADGELWFREVSWADTLFGYRTPNNHVLFSILSRLSHSGHTLGDAPDALHFDEARLRLPAFLFGLGSILSLGYLVAVIGYRRAALAAMFLLAFHPWFLRHAPEARGYPLTLCLGPLALAFLIKALRRGRGLYWIAFAACEALLFYAYPGTIYLLAGINLAALGYIAWARRDTARRDRTTLAGRWFAANTLAALPIVFLMMPNFPQLQAYLARERAQGDLQFAWLLENLSHLASGIPWAQVEPGNPLRLALGTSPVLSTALLAIFYGLAALGIYRLCRTRHRWLALALVLPYPLMLAHALAGRALLYQWYAVPLLPFVIVAVALGVEFLPSRIQETRARTLAGFAALAVFVSGYSALTHREVQILREHSVEPLRESVALTRTVLNPSHPDVDRALTVQFCQGTASYDPTAHFFKPESKEPDAPEKLRALLRRADAEGKPLHVNIALPGLARRDWPGLMEIVEDPELFEPLPPLYGLQDPCTRYVYRYRGSAARDGIAPAAADGS